MVDIFSIAAILFTTIALKNYPYFYKITKKIKLDKFLTLRR